MKKLIRASVFLLAVSSLVFASQISCKKSVAQTGTTSTNTPNIILYGKSVPVPGQPNDSSGNTTLFWSYQFTVANIDGTNPRLIPISLPSGLYAGQGGFLTSNGQTLVFTANNQAGTVRSIYSCAIDGTSLKKLADIDNNTQLLGAY